MEFAILGPVEARRDGRTLRLGGHKQRALLAILLLNANNAVSRDRLIEALWDEQRPAFQSPNAPKDRSAAAFATQFPQGRPWTMVFDKDDWLLGGVLRLNELTRALGTLEPAVLALEAQRKIGK